MGTVVTTFCGPKVSEFSQQHVRGLDNVIKDAKKLLSNLLFVGFCLHLMFIFTNRYITSCTLIHKRMSEQR